MKKVAKIDPEKEYETAKAIIDLASQKMLNDDQLVSLDSSVDNLITAARILIEREERRRGAPNPPKENLMPKGRKKGEERRDSKKLPSEKYPDAEIVEEVVGPKEAPSCEKCQGKMKESGLFQVSEKLEVIPKKYFITRKKYKKFNCPCCYGSMINTPADQSIVPTSNYGDSIIIDTALSKYCDLIPIERYAQMAMQAGLNGELPPQSLIGLTHHLANFLDVIYQKIKNEVLSSSVLLADETPHKMLEGDDTKNWYFWGFFNSHACYFETHNTRSGNVIFELLKNSKSTILLSDGYSGYGKAIKDIKQQFNRHIDEANCNAHAYRYFKDASITWGQETEIFLALYKKIYDLERERKELNADGLVGLMYRQKMAPFFEEIKSICEKTIPHVMPGSQFAKAINYFLNHYEGLTLCLKNIDIPLDNNLSERELRASVLGRKTWLGTHSKRGAITCAVLFTIVQSCKINGINPRKYFPWIVDRIHKNEELFTPYEYSQMAEIQ